MLFRISRRCFRNLSRHGPVAFFQVKLIIFVKVYLTQMSTEVAVDSEETSSRPAPPPNAPPAASVSLLNDGFPVLCDVNKDGISPSEAKQLLFNYVTTAWSTFIISSSKRALTNTVPSLRDSQEFQRLGPMGYIKFDCSQPDFGQPNSFFAF